MHAKDSGNDQPIEPNIDVQELLERPTAPVDEPPARVVLTVTRYVEQVVDEAIREHVALHHVRRVPLDSIEDLQSQIAPLNLLRRIGDGLEQAIEDHEARRHHHGDESTSS